MKRIFLLLAGALLFWQCSDVSQDDIDQLRKETDDLKAQLEAIEKGKTVIDLKFEEQKMIVVYNTTETDTLDIAGGLGDIQGAEGVGIASIEYNDETGILSITLTNGNTSEFEIYKEENQLKAKLISDINGKYLIKEVKMGDATLASVTYDENFNATEINMYQSDGASVNLFRKYIRKYEGDVLTGIEEQKFSTRNKLGFVEEYVDTWDEYVQFAENEGDFFYESNGDGSYTVHQLAYFNGEMYEYHKSSPWYHVTDPAILATIKAEDYDGPEGVPDGIWDWIQSIEIAKNVYHLSVGYNYRKILDDSNNLVELWYWPRRKITVLGEFQKGDVESTKFTKMAYDGSGNPAKVYESVAESGQPRTYKLNTFDDHGNYTKTEFYNWIDDAWSKSDEYLSYAYDGEMNLISTTKHIPSKDSTVVVQQAEYDANGNPVAVWGYMDAVIEYVYEFDPETGDLDWWKPVVIAEAGLRQVASIEYNYNYKNFFGNSISAIVPELEGYNLKNAPVKVTNTGTFNFGSGEYSQFNEGGYPQLMKCYGFSAENRGAWSVMLEISLTYTLKE